MNIMNKKRFGKLTLNTLIKFVLVILLLCFIVILLILSDGKRAYRQDAEKYLLGNLKSPATAEINTKCVTTLESYPNAVFVYGEVDSQNGFGAFIRNDWMVEFIKSTKEIIYFVFDDTIYFAPTGSSWKYGERYEILDATLKEADELRDDTENRFLEYLSDCKD